MHVQHISREQLQKALIASDCGLSLDDALSSPALARCLKLTALAMHGDSPQAPEPSVATCAELAWARRLLALAGKTDWAKLQAGDIEKDQL